MVDVTERFGAWILYTRRGTIFGLVVTALFLGVLYKTYLGSVTLLDAKHFECTMSRPDGLGSMCVEYRYKGK